MGFAKRLSGHILLGLWAKLFTPKSSQKDAFVAESDLPQLMCAIDVLVLLCMLHDHHEIMIFV